MSSRMSSLLPNGADALEDIQLEVRDLAVAYDGIRAVHSVCFTVLKGEIVTLIGANGAGKTSILRAVSGLVAYGGAVLFDAHLEAALGERHVFVAHPQSIRAGDGRLHVLVG